MPASPAGPAQWDEAGQWSVVRCAVGALRDAAWAAAGKLLHAKNDPEIGVDNFSDRPEVTALNALWTKVNIAVDASTKLHSLYELGKTVAELLPKP